MIFVSWINGQEEYCLSSAQILTSRYQSIVDKRVKICTGVHSLCSYSNHSQDTGCTIMDDIMTKANDLFPTQTRIEIPPLQP